MDDGNAFHEYLEAGREMDLPLPRVSEPGGHRPYHRLRAGAGRAAGARLEDLSRSPYVDPQAYRYMVIRLALVGAAVLLVVGFSIWALVLQSQNGSSVNTEERRRAGLEQMLWEKCTPNLGSPLPPIAYKDFGTYLLQDPSDVQFPLGWTTAGHQCLWDNVTTLTERNLTFDGILYVDDSRSLTVVDTGGLGVRPTFSLPAYLTRWTGPLLYVLLEGRCGMAVQENSLYLLLQLDGTPIPCTCRNSAEYCYQYPSPNDVAPVFLNDNKEVP